MAGDRRSKSILGLEVNDERTNTGDCSICLDTFTLLNRRHHCRYCGSAVCGNCSPKTVQLLAFGSPSRVCVQCYQLLHGMEGAQAKHPNLQNGDGSVMNGGTGGGGGGGGGGNGYTDVEASDVGHTEDRPFSDGSSTHTDTVINTSADEFSTVFGDLDDTKEPPIPFEDQAAVAVRHREYFAHASDLVNLLKENAKGVAEHSENLKGVVSSADINGFMHIHQRFLDAQAKVRAEALTGDVAVARDLLPEIETTYDETCDRAKVVTAKIKQLADLQRERSEDVEAKLSHLSTLTNSLFGGRLPPPSDFEVNDTMMLDHLLDEYATWRKSINAGLGKTFAKTEKLMKELQEALLEERKLISDQRDSFLMGFQLVHRIGSASHAQVNRLQQEWDKSDQDLNNTQILQRNCDIIKEELDTIGDEKEEISLLKDERKHLERENLSAREKLIEMNADLERLKLREENESRLVRAEEKVDEQTQLVQDIQRRLDDVMTRMKDLAWNNHPSLFCDQEDDIPKKLRQTGIIINRKFSDYEQVRLLGGSRHHVYLVKYNGQEVVLKQIPTSDKKALESEVTLLAKLRHPAIISVRGAFYDRLMAYIELPYVAGGNMKEWLAREKPTALTLRDTFRRIAEGIAFLHDSKVVHRDLKLENVLIESDTKPLICDFGISKESSGLGVTMTKATSAIGTEGYIAPEILKGDAGTKAVDLYALGIMLGRAHFGEFEMGQILEMTRKNKKSSNLPKSVQAADPNLRDLLFKLLKSKPQDRPTANDALNHPYFRQGAALLGLQTNKSNDRNNNANQFLSYVTGLQRGKRLVIDVSSQSIVESMTAAISKLSKAEFLRPIEFTLDGNEHHNMYETFFKAVTEKSQGLFEGPKGEESTISTYFPRADIYWNESTRSIYEMVGRIMLKVLIDKRSFSTPLANMVFKFIRNLPVDISDGQEVDKRMALELRHLLMTPNTEDSGRTFSGLVEDGQYMRVNDDNKHDYVNRKLERELVTPRLNQLQAIRLGFEHVSLDRHLDKVHWIDLKVMLNSFGHCDAAVVISHLEFRPAEWDKVGSTPKFFRDYIRELDASDLRRLLCLCTNQCSTKGLIDSTGKEKKIMVQKAPIEREVRFGGDFILELPDYSNIELLRHRLGDILHEA